MVGWLVGLLEGCCCVYKYTLEKFQPFFFLYIFLSFPPKCPNWKLSNKSEYCIRICTKYDSTGYFPTGWLKRERDRPLICCFSPQLSLTFQKKPVSKKVTGILQAENTCKSCFTFHQLSAIHCIKKRNCDFLLYTRPWWFAQTQNIEHMGPEPFWGVIIVTVGIHILSLKPK